MGSAGWTAAGSDGSYEYSTAALLVFWPETEHTELVARWPQFAGEVGATWDEHRQRVEQDCALVQRTEHEVNQVTGNVDDLAVFFGDHDITDPSVDDLHAYPDVQSVAAHMTAWPPGRTDSCWCGSGRKYKQCCRPHGLGSLSGHHD
jgi:uncharacterized protein YecA (UPF0149 family)